LKNRIKVVKVLQNYSNSFSKEKENSFFEKYKKNQESWGFWINLFIAVMGMGVSILCVIKSPNNFIIAVSIIGCQLAIVIMYTFTMLSFNKNKSILQESLDTNERKVKAINIQNDNLMIMCERRLQLSNKLVVYHKNINKRINNFLTLIFDETDKYRYNVNLINEKFYKGNADMTVSDLYISQLENENKKYENVLYDLYKRYIKGVVEETLNAITMQLRSREIQLKVALTIKLFCKTYHSNVADYKIPLYTAFRDKETYENNKEREIGGKHYTISLNGDFHKCLTKESYIKNNICDSMEDYLNENFPHSAKHYNCTAVVPIISDYKSDRLFYGFLCCDTLNHEYEEEIFDKLTADVLYSAALTMGMFFDNINAAWSYNYSEEKEIDFLSYLHKLTYHRPE